MVVRNMAEYIKRSRVRVMQDTVSALLIRELKARFGSKKLGYFWALALPAVEASAIAVIFTVLGRSSLSGVPVALFLLVGTLPYKSFFRISNAMASGIKSNKALFSYRQVAPIDPVITRFIIEVATHFIVFFLLMLFMLWLGFDSIPEKPLELIMVNIIMALTAAGLGLCLCSAVQYYEDTLKIFGLITQPLFFISGVFFAITMIPSQYWGYLTWNPLLHVIELSRDAMFSSYRTPIGDWFYLVKIMLVLWGMGLSLYWVNRQKFLAI